MLICLSGEISYNLFSHISDYTTITSDKLEKYFSSKGFGISVESIYIGIICVTEGFDFFHTVREKYSNAKRVLSFDVKLDPDACLKIEYIEFLQMLRGKLLGSLDVFERKKIKNFNVDDFRTELEKFFVIAIQEEG